LIVRFKKLNEVVENLIKEQIKALRPKEFMGECENNLLDTFPIPS